MARSAQSEAMASPELKTMLELTPELVAGIAKGPQEIAEVLFSKGLIAEEVKGKLSLSSTAVDQACILVENITSKVKECSKIFQYFLDILRNCGWLDELVKSLEDTFGMFGSSMMLLVNICVTLPV